jgi:hypothetical protein
MNVLTPQIIYGYIWVLGIDTQLDGHLYEINGVLMYTLRLHLPKAMPLDPLVLYIPDRVGLGLNEGFEVLPLCYWWITL